MIYAPLASRPRPTQKEVKAAIATFCRRGKTRTLKQDDKLLPHIMNYCINHGVGFDLVYRADEGYFVKRSGAE